MKVSALCIMALATLSVGHHKQEAKAVEVQLDTSAWIRSKIPSPIRARKKDKERVRFELYERVHFEFYERVRFDLLPDNPWTFNITIGNQRQAIGSWWGGHMYNETKAWLSETCGQTEKWGSDKCSSGPWSRTIEIDKKGKAEYVKEAASVHISSHYIPEEYGVGLQEAFIEQITETFVLAVADDKNCFKFDRLSTTSFLVRLDVVKCHRVGDASPICET